MYLNNQIVVTVRLYFLLRALNGAFLNKFWWGSNFATRLIGNSYSRQSSSSTSALNFFFSILERLSCHSKCLLSTLNQAKQSHSGGFSSLCSHVTSQKASRIVHISILVTPFQHFFPYFWTAGSKFLGARAVNSVKGLLNTTERLPIPRT
jgi:hypothetical protein